MRRTFIGPFHRYAIERQPSGEIAVYDAEAGTPAPVVATFSDEAFARRWIDEQIAADPSMAEGFNATT